MAKTGKQPGSNRDGLQGEKLASKTGRPDAKEPTSIIATGTGYGGGSDAAVEGRFGEGGVGVRIKGGGGDEK